MKCENCGKEINVLCVNEFYRDGSDGFSKIPIKEIESAVFFDIDRNWTGYELSEEEQVETIECPNCGEYPFMSHEIHIDEIVRVIMFKKDSSNDR